MTDTPHPSGATSPEAAPLGGVAPDAGTAEPAVRFEGVSKSFIGKNGRTVQALQDVTLDVARGSITGLVGYSGAGKSTLLRTVNALERPTSGRVIVDGRDMSKLQGAPLYAARQKIGMIFQQFNLLQSRNVYKNVAYPMKIAGMSKDQILDRVEELLDFVGLTDKALQYPSQLSGGQKQRVAIARALATRPDILISDEATSALDPQTTGEVLELLQRVNREYGVTILLVTHEMDVIREIADRVAVMEHGRVVEFGDTYEVFSNPQSSVAARFVSSVLHHLPAPDVLARIRSEHPGRLIQVLIEDRHSDKPYLTRLAVKHGIEVNFIYGGIHELRSRLFGNLTLELQGSKEKADAALADLRTVTDVADLGTAEHPLEPTFTLDELPDDAPDTTDETGKGENL